MLDEQRSQPGSSCWLPYSFKNDNWRPSLYLVRVLFYHVRKRVSKNDRGFTRMSQLLVTMSFAIIPQTRKRTSSVFLIWSQEQRECPLALHI